MVIHFCLATPFSVTLTYMEVALNDSIVILYR